MRLASSTADRPRPRVAVDENARRCVVLQVDLLAELGEEDDGELEALGMVDAHDADDVGGLGEDGGLAESVSISRLSRNLRKR